MNNKLINYVIYAPTLTSSAGIRALYRLSEELEKRGFSAPVLCLESSPGYHCINTFTKEMQENDIIIYPEIISGNPFGFHRVVRYVLYFPGKLGGDASFDEHEYVISWSHEYYKDVPVLRIPLIDRQLFYDAGLPKTHDCAFHHKDYGVHRQIESKNLVEITMNYPKNRSDLAKLLQTTETLYSFDQHSMLNDEAVLCGAKVLLVTDKGFIPYVYEPEDNSLFERQLEEVIKNTQGLISYRPKKKKDVNIVMKLKLLFHSICYAIFNNKSSKQRIIKYKFHLGIPS